MPRASPPPSCWCGKAYTNAATIARRSTATPPTPPPPPPRRARPCRPALRHSHCSACDVASPAARSGRAPTRPLPPADRYPLASATSFPPPGVWPRTPPLTHDDGLLDPLRELPAAVRGAMRSCSSCGRRSRRGVSAAAATRSGCSVSVPARHAHKWRPAALCCRCCTRFHSACTRSYGSALVVMRGGTMTSACPASGAGVAARRRRRLDCAPRRSGLRR